MCSWSDGQMDERSRTALEFAGILNFLREGAATPLGKERGADVRPLKDPTRVREALAEAGEMKALLDRAEEPPFAGVSDIRPHLARARLEGAALEPGALWEIYETVTAAHRLRTFFRRAKDAAPLLWKRASSLTPPEALCAAIAEAITPEKGVADTASPGLSAARREMRALRKAVVAKLERYLTSPAYQSALAEAIITIRNQRYVIPVKAAAKSQIRGIVQDQSGSGQTLFLEPTPVVEMNNRLRVLEGREEEEVQKVLLSLTAQVRCETERIRDLLECLAGLDLLLATGRLAVRLTAHIPRVTEDRRLILYQARHPFLVIGRASDEAGVPGARDAVPIDLEVGGAFSVLVISGPNTGGKTVALKTAGILTVMALSGLPIPASADSQVPCYGAVLADIGDEQSIAESLSTFSSHMGQIVRILDRAGPETLVLLDELGAGTDPADGAALGIAILEFLRERGASVIAATHLEAIKAFAAVTAGVENASVEIDPELLVPRYRIRRGLPGQSYGLEIAGRLGLPAEILKRARGILPEGHRQAQALIEVLEEERQRIEGLRARLERGVTQAGALAREAADLLGRLREQAGILTRRAREEARQVVADLRERGEGLIRALTDRSAQPEEARTFRRGLEVLSKEVEATAAAPIPAPRPSADIGPGRWVRVAGLGREGRVLTEVSPQGTVEVELGIGRVHLPVAALHPAPSPGRPECTVPFFVETTDPISPEINLVGCTVEESSRRLEKYLDAAFLQGLRQVRVIHGKGTGALRKGVHQFLAAHPLVEEYRLAELNEGGSGATVAALKER